MARRVLNRLTTKEVASAGDGRHADGGGLYLAVDGSRRRWQFMWQPPGGKRQSMGLGSAVQPGGVSLAEARKAASDARDLVEDGLDPREERKTEAEAAKPAPTATFGECALQFIDSQEAGWKNDKHRQQWRNTLKTYCAPLWKRPVDQITTEDVLKVLKPIWQAKPETASRLRGRIERVLSAAKVRKLRSGENVAQWRGHLDHLLPPAKKLSRGHHAALPYEDLPSFMADLRTRDAVGAWALQFTILTAARTGEVIGARWAEIDEEAKVWTIPAARMKAGREHRVPLTQAAIDVLTKAKTVRTVAEDDPDAVAAAPIFPADDGASPMSNMTMAATLKRMGLSVTVHGFRSTFRDWAGDATGFPRDICESALAHTLRDSTEAAYRRSDALEKRRKLMTAWAGYCASKPSGEVVNINSGKRAKTHKAM